MINIDLNALGQALFDRLATDSAASDLRALLGSLTDSIVHARLLEDNVRPPRPFLAFREGPIITRDRIVNTPIFDWFIYDDPDQGYSRINQLIPLTSKAYAAAPIQLTDTLVANLAITGGSRATRDPAMGLLMRFVTVSIDATWA